MSVGTFRRWVLAASALGLVAAGPGASGAGAANSQLASKFTNQGINVRRLTASVQMTKDDVPPARAYAGPTSMAADPANPRIIVAATAQMRTRTCYMLRSTDGGTTWHTAPGLPGPPSYQYCTNGNAGVPVAMVAFGRNGTVYYARQAYGDNEGGTGMATGGGHSSIILAKSTDLGTTWSTTFVDNNRGKGGLMNNDNGVTGLAVDTSGPQDIVYVGYGVSYPGAAPNTPEQNGALNVAVSTNGGASFNTTVNLNDFSHVTQNVAGMQVPLLMGRGFGAPYLTVHDGVVLAVAGPSNPYNVKLPLGSTFAYALPQLLARSTDQGKTWTVSAFSPPIFTGAGSFTGLGWTPKGGPHGTFVAAYAMAPENAPTSNTENVVVERSTDLGQTWSAPQIIDDDNPADKATSFYPQLSVAPNGRVDVVWEDNRKQVDYHFQVRASYSNDGGQTWAPNVLVNDKPIDFGLGVSFNSDIRQPPGVASTNMTAVYGWADTRLGNATNQNQDDFASVAQFSALPGRSSTLLPILEGIFGGLVAAGIILLIVLAVRSRRTPPPVTPTVEDERQSASVGTS
jgi:hypothetical protein